MPAAHFVITGEAIAEHARGLMLSDRPGEALRVLCQCLVGDGVIDVAHKVLAGESQLTGDSKKGVGVKPARKTKALRRYLKDLQFIYAGRVRLNNCWHRPRGRVTRFDGDDARAALKSLGRVSLPLPLSDAPGSKAFAKLRATYYALPNERVELVEIDNVETFVVFEPCGEPPQWLTPAATAQEATTTALAAGRRLQELGAEVQRRPQDEAEAIITKHNLGDAEADELRDLADAAEEERWKAEMQRIGERVREQAGDDVFPLELGDGRTVQVPRVPFMYWALTRLPERRSVLPPWDLVSESGLKLSNDNPYHSDWVLGAGLEITESYADHVNKPAWRYAAKIQYDEVDRD